MSCESTTGQTWNYGKITKTSISRNLLFLNSGDAVECHLSFESGEQAYVYIIGYFTEKEKLASLDIMLDKKGVHVLLNGSKINGERLSRSEIIKELK